MTVYRLHHQLAKCKQLYCHTQSWLFIKVHKTQLRSYSVNIFSTVNSETKLTKHRPLIDLLIDFLKGNVQSFLPAHVQVAMRSLERTATLHCVRVYVLLGVR